METALATLAVCVERDNYVLRDRLKLALRADTEGQLKYTDA